MYLTATLKLVLKMFLLTAGWDTWQFSSDTRTGYILGTSVLDTVGDDIFQMRNTSVAACEVIKDHVTHPTPR